MDENVASQVCVTDLDGLESLIDGLPANQKEALLEQAFKKLPAEAKARLIGEELRGSGLVVVMGGSNLSVNTEVFVQIQNAPDVDLSGLLEAIVERVRRDRSSGESEILET